jgi:hypothetical protein
MENCVSIAAIKTLFSQINMSDIISLFALILSAIAFWHGIKRKVSVILSVPQDAKDSVTTRIVVANDSNSTITIEDIQYKTEVATKFKRLVHDTLPATLKPFEAYLVDTDLFTRKANITALYVVDSFGKVWKCRNIPEARVAINNLRTTPEKFYPEMSK